MEVSKLDVKYAASIKPTKRQIKIQELEFYGFIHFGINTMYGVEWGSGKEEPKRFYPDNINTDDWIKTLKSAGMRGAILTCKHHDGFCLWPSKYTEHSVASSPWKNGQGDLVKEFSLSCEKYDMEFGVYLSPWDMYEPTYGTGKEYDDFFVNQLTELLTNYGKVFNVWFDGANGEGPNGKVQEYDWDRYYRIVRELQPEAVISVSGPDVRWVGNEAGKTRENEWSVVPAFMKDPAITAGLSQQEDSPDFRETFTTGDEDLGSRKRLNNYNGKLIWYPAEVDLSIRPGWFYHAEEDKNVRTSDNLFNIYKDSVGNNTTLLLNVPPMPSGEIHDNDKIVLKELGEKIKNLYENNAVKFAQLSESSNEFTTSLEDILKPELDGKYFQFCKNDNQPLMELSWEKPVLANTLILGEYIPRGQLIDGIQIELKVGGEWTRLIEVESIGYRRILSFPEQVIESLRIKITSFREQPNLNFILLTYDNFYKH